MQKKNCLKSGLTIEAVVKINFVTSLDDVRLFLKKKLKYPEYPSIDFFFDWARRFNMNWRIEHDIFVM